MHRTLMLYVNEIGFYALNEKYSAENQLVNIHATAKRGFISIATGKKKVGTAAMRWYKLTFVNESGFYAFLNCDILGCKKYYDAVNQYYTSILHTSLAQNKGCL